MEEDHWLQRPTCSQKKGAKTGKQLNIYHALTNATTVPYTMAKKRVLFGKTALE